MLYKANTEIGLSRTITEWLLRNLTTSSTIDIWCTAMNHMNRYSIRADIQKEFHHIRLDEKERDAQRLVWYNNLEEWKIVALRYTRVVFAACPSPYIIDSTLSIHLYPHEDIYPETVQALKDDTYVDDAQYGSNIRENLRKFKEEAKMILQKKD